MFKISKCSQNYELSSTINSMHFWTTFQYCTFSNWLIPLSLTMGINPNKATNIFGTPFNLLVMFNTSMVHIKCHIIMCLCIALVLYGVVFDCVFRCSYTSIDQAVGVSPQYPDDPYYQPVEQGKRNPPLSMSPPMFYANIFSTILLHAVPNVNLVGLEYPIVALCFRCQYLFPS